MGLRLHESGEVHEGTNAERGLELQEALGNHLRLLDAAGQGKRRSPQPVEDAEARVGLYRLRQARGRFVVAPEAKPHDAEGDMTLKAQGIEGAKTQRPVGVVLGEHGVAADGMNVRAPIESGGARAVQ